MTVATQGDVVRYSINGQTDETAKGVVIMTPGNTSPQGSAANPVVTSASAADKAALDLASGTYSGVVAYAGATTVGRGVAIVCTVAGTATLTLTSGSIVVPVAVGLTILPFACTNAVQTTGTMTLYKLT